MTRDQRSETVCGGKTWELAAAAIVCGLAACGPLEAESPNTSDEADAVSPALAYPADKPELEYLDFWRLDTNLPRQTTPGTDDYTRALTVSPTQLNSYSDSYFRIATGGGVSMKARFGGAVTSSNTAYARTELREMASATSQASWSCLSAAKTMRARLRIKSTGRYKPELTVAQIHDKDSDKLMIQYVYDRAQNGGALPATGAIGDRGRIIAAWNGTRAGATVLDPSYTVGDTIDLTITANGVAGAGLVQVEYRNATRGTSVVAGTRALQGVSGGCYFKVGNYHQSCTKSFVDGSVNQTCKDKGFPPGGVTWEPDADATATSEVMLYDLTVSPKG
jgi:hypothetical protein